MAKRYSVYLHRNKINGKVYIGITCQKPEYRWGKQGKRYTECPHFWKAILKYGWDNFDHKIIVNGLPHDEACKTEIALISHFNATDPRFGYNISYGGDGISTEQSKRWWLTASNKEYARRKMKKAWEDPAKRKRRSEAAKKRWNDPCFREHVRERIIASCGRAVVCVETGEVFEAMKDVEKRLG